MTNPELEAEIYYLTPEQGGRNKAVLSGYRGQFYYNGKNWDAPQEFIDREICELGESINVRLQTLSPDFHVGQFLIGQEFETREGGITVGKGKITKILKPDFNFWDYQSFFHQLPEICKPYDKQDIDGFIADCEYSLNKIKQIKNLHFTKTLSNRAQMLTIDCNVRNKNTTARPLIDEICNFWKEDISFKYGYYKIRLEHFANYFEFQLEFATWHSMYVTGRVKLSTK